MIRPGVLSAPRFAVASGGLKVWQALAAAAVVASVFKLALSDGGRHPASLALVQTVVLVMLLVLVASGRLRPGPLVAGIGAVIAAVALTAVWSVRPDASVRELLLWLTYLAVAALAAWAIRTPRAAAWFTDGLLVAAAWLCLIALFMFWGNAGDTTIRWASTFYWPNPFAAFLALVFPLALVRMLRGRSAREAAGYGGAVVLLGTTIVFTASRGVWIALAAALPVMLAVLRPPSWGMVLRRGLAAGVLLAAAVVVLGRVGPAGASEPLARRAASIVDPMDPSVQGRLRFWGSALRIFADHPAAGTGAGTFGAVHPAYQRDARFYARDTHNLYLQTMAEMGLPGVVALGALLLSLATIWAAALRSAPSAEHYSVAVGAGVGLLTFFVHSAVDMDWAFPASPAMAFALAGVLGAIGQESRAPLSRLALLRRSGRQGAARAGRLAAAAALLAVIVAVQAGQVAHNRYLLGQAAARGGRWDDAASFYAQAARWNPLSAVYPRAEGLAVMQTPPADRRRAESALRRAMALDRMNAAHPIQLARIVTGGPEPTAEDFSEAEVLLHRALALDPFNRPGAYGDLARLYLRRGRRAEAGEVYRDATGRYVGRGLGGGSLLHLFLWPEIVSVMLEAVEFMVEEGDAPGAERILAAVLAEDPAAAAAALRLAQLYVASGRPAAAAAVLKEAARYLPADERIRRALLDLSGGAP